MTGQRSRIAILAPLKSWGGLERKFTTLCNEFVELGVRPEILQLRGGEVPYPDDLSSQVRTLDLGTRSKRDGIARVARYLRREPPAALLTARDHSAQVAVMARWLARADVPVFIKATNMPSAVIRRRAQRFMARRLYPHADGVIAISRGVAEDVLRTCNVASQRVHLIYNPAITRGFERRLESPVAADWFPEPGGGPVVVGAGRLTQQKDFATLIRAFAHLRAHQEARLLILGDGAERAALEQLALDCGVAADVHLPGRVADPVPYMRRADLFAFSSRYEGLGNVLIEALASGTRLVATDCPSGPREILADGRYGRLVPPCEPELLGQAMAAALAEPRPPKQEVEQAVERFAAAPVARRYLEVMGVPHGHS